MIHRIAPWLPTAVLLSWALILSSTDVTRASRVVFLIVFAFSLALQACENRTRRKRRKSDPRHEQPNGRKYVARRRDVARDLWLLAISLLVVWSLLLARQESHDRQDQLCTVLERDSEAQIIALKRTYDYVEKLTPKERGDGINVAVISNLERQRKETIAAAPPPFCDTGELGLPEPGPRLPPKPKPPPVIPNIPPAHG